MRMVATVLLILTLGATGCSRPAQPTGSASEHGVRYSSSASSEHLAWAPDLQVQAEYRWEPSVSGLLPDLENGVWGGQDGELFHFAIRSRAQAYQRVAYGRPAPASVWTGGLSWLSPDRLAGVTVTLHLFKRSPDGVLEELGHDRSPAGAPFDLLDIWGGKLRLRDALGTWYTLEPEGEKIHPLAGPLPAGQPRHSGLDATAQQQFEQAANGRFRAWGVDLPDRTAFALIMREQLFTFDLTLGKFTLLGAQEQIAPAPMGALDGQIVAGSPDGILLIDPETGVRRVAWQGDIVGLPHLFEGGWLYALPHKAVNLRTGEERLLARLQLGGGVAAVTPLADGRLAAGTGHGGAIFLTDPATGQHVWWGRPLPELGQESGEEMAPISGLAAGKDGFLYAAVGPGAQGLPYAHIVRLDPHTGMTLGSIRVDEPVHCLVAGADGRLYAAGRSRVIWIILEGM